jgi:alpha-beta hydrolase superfamily lysophospholipase
VYPAVVRKWLIRALVALPVLIALLAVGGAMSAVRRLPDLHPWHRLVSTLEPRAAEITPAYTLEAYLAREEAVFQELHNQVVPAASAGANPAVPNRFVEGSRSYPENLGTNLNRTQILTVPEPKGGALLIHGLTDSPYSMRAMAERLHAAGFYTVSLRMQGHGTAPGGLVNTSWEDWAAAVRLGARHVSAKAGAGKPLILVGYSNGGALVTKYALDALSDSSLPQATKLVLVSPMIGVSAAAALAGPISLLGPVVEKARWIDVVPEYNPFKYNSFPANAGRQTARITRTLSSDLASAAGEGSLQRMPPVLVFQSLLDTTVSTAAVLFELLDRLPANRNELVLFDLNREAGIDAFTRPDAILPRLIGEGPRPYAVTLVTNSQPSSMEVSAKSVAPGATAIVEEPLGMSWPDGIYSLSHVALPFPADDPIYGGAGLGRESGSVSLGRLSPRGEKGALLIPADVLMRVLWNPFFPYLARRLDSWVVPVAPAPMGSSAGRPDPPIVRSIFP